MDFLELFRSQLNGPVMERLGGVLGLDAAQAQQIGQAVLPAQLKVITDKVATTAGAQHVLDLAAQVPHGTPQDLLAAPDSLTTLRQKGTALLPQLLGNRLDDTVQDLAQQTGASRGGVQGMMQMILPLMLGMIGQQAGKFGLNASTLGGLFSGGAAGLGDGLSAGTTNLSKDVRGTGAGIGAAATGVGAAAAGLGSTAGAGAVGGASRGVGGVVTDGMATVGEGAGLGGGVLHSNPALGGRRGLGWLWLLPLLLLLLLGGCFLLRGKPAATFAVTEPANGAAVSGPFAVKGTGTAGEEITVSENGQPVGKATVGEDGTFSADVPAPTAGDHTYAISEAGSSENLNLTVKAAAAAAAAGTAAAAGDMSGMDMNGKFSIAAPASDANLPAGAFELKGSGKPGDVLEIFEDGVSLGKVTVGTDGMWTLNVPSPAAGAHTYSIKGPDGAELGSVKATVAAAAASTAACTKDFSLSIPDGQTVAEPFRFGGVGSGRSYTVTVTRGDRKIGSKVLPLDGTCGYSYTSKPGKGTITYSVSQTGSADVAGKITLTVK